MVRGRRLRTLVLIPEAEQDGHEKLPSLPFSTATSSVTMGILCHELSNMQSAAAAILTNLTRAYGLEQDQTAGALRTLLDSIAGFLDSIRGEQREVAGRTVDICGIIDKFLAIASPAFRKAGISPVVDVPDGVRVCGESGGLTQVLLNLALNAERALRTAPERRFGILGRVENGRCVLRVSNTGSCVAEPDSLFKPFSRGAAGRGLGLFISRAIIRNFGGELSYEEIASRPVFKIDLELSSEDNP
jgi:C4-dicarboxylate-specific signal transduction histidine kinase